MTFSEKFNQAYNHARAAFEIFDELHDVFDTRLVDVTMAEDFLEAFDTLTFAVNEVKSVRDEWDEICGR